MTNSFIVQIKHAVVDGKHKEIQRLVQSAIEEKTSLEDILNSGLIAAMDVVGQKFSDGQIFVPEMLASAFTMKKGLDIVKPIIKGADNKSIGTIVMGTVKGDLHDIGKNLFCMMLEGAGFKVIDLGIDLTVEKVVQQVRKIKPDILGLSALLTTTMPEMKRVIEELKINGLRDSVKVIVGGAPVSANFAKKIGADGYGEDAAEAVQLSKKLVSKN
ncbi:MAG: corrinoid protein [Deltaproteobacteria bacterium]|nr:MAG: corrinoid protein [Deltaproteobacteria bacterium]